MMPDFESPVLGANKPQRGNLPRGIFPCTEKLRNDSHGKIPQYQSMSVLQRD